MLLAILFALTLPAHAAEVAGVKLDDHAQVGERQLVLNGAGLRKRLVFKGYVAGLYLPQRATRADVVLAMPGDKRMRLTMLREVDADTFLEAFTQGFENNTAPAEREALKAHFATFSQLMLSTGKAREGDIFTLDGNDAGTTIAVNGRALGKPIPGAAFYRALLNIWLGDKPVQEDLKRALLGG
jgi:hypothetical protein